MRYLVHLRLVALVLLASFISACGGSNSANVAPTPTTSPFDVEGGMTMQLVLAASEVVIGENRFPLGLIVGGTPARDPNIKIHLQFKHAKNDPDRVRAEADAIYRGENLPVGIYVAQVNFEEAGDWNVLAQVDKGDGKLVYLNPMRINVLEKSPTPAVGEAAPPSDNLTVRDQPDLAKLTSDYAPDEKLYQLSIREALAQKKPFVVLFGTPGFCQTATCGPNMVVMKKLQEQYGDKVNFIHVEVYPYPFSEAFQSRTVVQSMKDWNLQTEPWTFMVDAEGKIFAKYEGGITFSELEPKLKELIES
jgi:hypothetical protein